MREQRRTERAQFWADALKICGGVIAFLLIADVFGFLAWVLSGQMPADNFYLGTITAHALRFIIGLI